MRDPLIFLIRTFTDFYLLAFLLRFILQWIKADFYNPLTQAIVKITTPLIQPFRGFIPSSKHIDTPTLVVLVLLEIVVTWVLITLAGLSTNLFPLLILVFLRLISLTLWFYSVSIFIYVILSWFGQQGYNPIAQVLSQLNEPLLRPFRRILPSMAGIDFSPMLALILLQAGLMTIPLPAFLR
ncbi:MAG: YggT family protein [Rhodospirillaceae bacterium]|nr:YggT family protein [Rhodospirillaceae bacterium]|tara:strand:+ start:126 stop:671 length:546 start_codon:yes stop_codon:yes gene_type:complete